MSVEALNCQCCGAALKVSGSICECEYCGATNIICGDTGKFINLLKSQEYPEYCRLCQSQCHLSCHDRFPPETSRHVERFQLKERTCLQPQHKVHMTTTVNHTTRRAGVTQGSQLPRDTYQTGHPESSQITSQETREKVSPQLR